MFPSVTANDWSETDNWWDNFRQERSLVLAPPSIRKMPDVKTGRHWSSVDSFWNAFVAGHEELLAEKRIQQLVDNPRTGAWQTVDDFWDGYAEQQQDELLALREAMATLREAWNDGCNQFDDDPLSTNWRAESQYEGPLRTTVNEEAWSQWLGHLLRTSSGHFVHELLGTPDEQPTSVRREVVFFGDSSQRRVDILVEYEDIGVSIEVKQGDTHYGKTPETAGLVERNDSRDWSHVLLLQKEKLPRLHQTFGDELDRSADGAPTIRSDQSADIDVRYWREVSRVLRRMLLEGGEPDSHWQASAYLFITLIEQRILGLHSFSFVDPTVASSETPPATDIHRLVVVEPDKQTNYLRTVLNEEYNHE